MFESKYLRFELIPKASRKRKLPSWYVFSKKQDLPLGEIVWKFVWRCYVFEPYCDTQWNCDCLVDVAKFIGEQTKAETGVTITSVC